MTIQPVSTNGTGSNQPARPWRVIDAIVEMQVELMELYDA